MDLLSIAILVQFCIVILLPSKQSSGKAAQGGSIMRAGGEGIKKIFTCKYNFYVFSPMLWVINYSRVVLGPGEESIVIKQIPFPGFAGSRDRTGHVLAIRLEYLR